MQARTPPILTPPETPGSSSSGLQLHSPTTRTRPYHFSTLCATVENPGAKDQYGSSSVPIYQTATFKGVGGEYDYSRSGNPTRSHLGTSDSDLSATAPSQSPTDRLCAHRTPSSKDIFRSSCLRCILGDGGFGRRDASAQNWRRGHRRGRSVRGNEPAPQLPSSSPRCHSPSCRHDSASEASPHPETREDVHGSPGEPDQSVAQDRGPGDHLRRHPRSRPRGYHRRGQYDDESILATAS